MTLRTRIPRLFDETTSGGGAPPGTAGHLTFFFRSNIAPSANFPGLHPITQPTPTTTATRWTVGTEPINDRAGMEAGVTRPTTAFTTTGDIAARAAPDNTVADCYRTWDPITGSFIAGNWEFVIQIISIIGTTARGRFRFRLWRGTDPTGVGATQVFPVTVGGVSASAELLALSTTVANPVARSFPLSALTLNNEYLFLQLEWDIRTATGTTASDRIALRADGSATFVSTLLTSSLSMGTAESGGKDTANFPVTVTSDITFTLAATETGKDTANFQISPRIDLALAVTEANKDTASFVVSPQIDLTLAATEANKDTASFVVSPRIDLAVTATEPAKDTASFQISPRIDFTLGTTEPAKDTASFLFTIGDAISFTMAAVEAGKDSAFFILSHAIPVEPDDGGGRFVTSQQLKPPKPTSRVSLKAVERGGDTASFKLFFKTPPALDVYPSQNKPLAGLRESLLAQAQNDQDMEDIKAFLEWQRSRANRVTSEG